MEKEIKKVLSIIEKSGFEAYIIGGYVRDLLLKKQSYDVDICTNALPKDLMQLFPNGNSGIYGAVDFKKGKFSFEITTYRKEYNYQNRHPKRVEYTSNLLEDIQRRDFKINTLCMNSKGNIIDILGAMDDISNKQLNPVGDIDKKIKEDPLRILRAIRIATVLEFNLSDDIKKAIKANAELVKTLSDYRLIDELTKVLLCENYDKGLKSLAELKVLDYLGIHYNNIIKTKDINGMWAQICFEKPLAFNKETIHNINTIKKIIEIGDINRRVLFDYGLYYSMVAGEILNLDRQKISSIYKKMPIKSKKDLALSTEKIIDILKPENNNEISGVLNALVDQILAGNIKNKSKDIYRYLTKNKEAK